MIRPNLAYLIFKLVLKINHFNSHVSELLVDSPKQQVEVLCALKVVGQSENLNNMIPGCELAHLVFGTWLFCVGSIHYGVFLCAKC